MPVCTRASTLTSMVTRVERHVSTNRPPLSVSSPTHFNACGCAHQPNINFSAAPNVAMDNRSSRQLLAAVAVRSPFETLPQRGYCPHPSSCYAICCSCFLWLLRFTTCYSCKDNSAATPLIRSCCMSDQF